MPSGVPGIWVPRPFGSMSRIGAIAESEPGMNPSYSSRGWGYPPAPFHAMVISARLGFGDLAVPEDEQPVARLGVGVAAVRLHRGRAGLGRRLGLAAVLGHQVIAPQGAVLRGPPRLPRQLLPGPDPAA